VRLQHAAVAHTLYTESAPTVGYAAPVSPNEGAGVVRRRSRGVSWSRRAIRSQFFSPQCRECVMPDDDESGSPSASSEVRVSPDGTKRSRAAAMPDKTL